MKFTLQNIDLETHLFDCINGFRILTTNLKYCEQCKPDFYSCWKNKITSHIKHLCLCNNAVKYIKLNKTNHCSLCNRLYQDITTGSDGKVEFYCQNCNSTELIEITEIKNVLKDEFEIIDERALETILNQFHKT